MSELAVLEIVMFRGLFMSELGVLEVMLDMFMTTLGYIS